MDAPRSQPEQPQPLSHAEHLDQTLARLAVDPAEGLSPREAEERQKRYGKNRLPEPQKRSEWLRFLSQFTSPLVLTLVFAALIALLTAALGLEEHAADKSFLARYGDALAIFGILLLNAILGYVQEHRAERALEALQALSAPNARVLREGKVQMLRAEDLVPGDILLLEAGDAVAADARLLSSSELTLEEAALTGESVPVEKDEKAVLSKDTEVAERTNLVFLGTTVAAGKGQALVVATGVSTELGKIGAILSGLKEAPTPLEENLRVFGTRVLIGCLAFSALLFGYGLLQAHRSWPLLLLEAVSFAVAAIPEGLPAITTITLALGMTRMAKRGVLIRKLPAVETLGMANVICTDKTGTLTQNHMTVREIHAQSTYRVTGVGYDHTQGGIFLPAASEATVPTPGSPLHDLLVCGALCNTAHLRADKVVGDPMEGALLTLCQKGGLSPTTLRKDNPVAYERPFDSTRRRMTVVVKEMGGAFTAHSKGSLDVILASCTHLARGNHVVPLTEEVRTALLAEGQRMAEGALRVLALSKASVSSATASQIPEDNQTFLGMVGLMDPPRAGVKEAIETCHTAGVQVVMITGDHSLTAKAIAKELSMWEPGDEILTGAELQHLSEGALKDKIASGKVRIFARTTADQKLRIVRAYKDTGQVVAMTGDGVNDAPALREAHIGVAMGQGGTDVARQAAEIVITDDNFATIVQGIAEGRAIYHNIQKFIFYLLSSNVALAVAVVGAALVPSWLPLTPLQILGINFVTNGLPALALGIGVATQHNDRQMRMPPRAPGSGLFSTRDYLGLLFSGGIMGVCALLIYAMQDSGLAGRTMAYALLGLAPLFHVWNCRSPVTSLFAERPIFPLWLLLSCGLSFGIHLLGLLLPPLFPVFGTTHLSGASWLFVLGLSFGVIPLVELAKAVNRRSQPSGLPKRGTPPLAKAEGETPGARRSPKRIITNDPKRPITNK